jgi:hypothetical protein
VSGRIVCGKECRLRLAVMVIRCLSRPRKMSQSSESRLDAASARLTGSGSLPHLTLPPGDRRDCNVIGRLMMERLHRLHTQSVDGDAAVATRLLMSSLLLTFLSTTVIATFTRRTRRTPSVSASTWERFISVPLHIG